VDIFGISILWSKDVNVYRSFDFPVGKHPHALNNNLEKLVYRILLKLYTI
jgi:hypothetical protein